MARTVRTALGSTATVGGGGGGGGNSAVGVGGVKVTVHQQEIDRLTRSDNVRAMLLERSQPVVFDARGRAPKATGRGAASIQSEAVLTDDEWTAVVTWDQLHYYMYFSEAGTVQRPPAPFLVPALRAAGR